MDATLKEKSMKLMQALKDDPEFPKLLKKQNANVMKEIFSHQKELGIDLLDEVTKDFVRIAAAQGYSFTYDEAKACIQYQNDVQEIKDKYSLPEKYHDFVEKAKNDPTFETYLRKSRRYLNKIFFTNMLKSGMTAQIEAQVIPDFIKLAAQHGVELNEDETKEIFKAQFEGMQKRAE